MDTDFHCFSSCPGTSKWPKSMWTAFQLIEKQVYQAHGERLLVPTGLYILPLAPIQGEVLACGMRRDKRHAFLQ